MALHFVLLLSLVFAADYTFLKNQNSGDPLGAAMPPYDEAKMRDACDQQSACCGFTTGAQLKTACGAPTPTPPFGGVSLWLKVVEPDKPKGGLSGGSAFLIIFFVALFLYCALGIFYNVKRKGTTGVNSVPNIDFWKDVPGLVKDGFLFVKSKLVKQQGSV